MNDQLVIAGKAFRSRLIVGTGKYRTPEEMVQAIDASGAQMVTVALKRIDFNNREKTILDHIDWTQYDGKKILVKGCGSVPAPTWAYMLVAAYLANHADYVGYGEGCSSVTVYKRAKSEIAS